MNEQQKRKIQQFHPEIEDGIDLRRCPLYLQEKISPTKWILTISSCPVCNIVWKHPLFCRKICMPSSHCDSSVKHVTPSDPLSSKLSNFWPLYLTSPFKRVERQGLLHSKIGLNQGWCVKDLSAEMNLMKFQVLPLRVLASREVVRERLDYKEHLGSATRDELDNLE